MNLDYMLVGNSGKRFKSVKLTLESHAYHGKILQNILLIFLLIRRNRSIFKLLNKHFKEKVIRILF